MNQAHQVVIIGGGFGGLETARRLKHAPVRVTLIDRRNFHLFQALLYQVATGALSPANIAAPLRAILKRQKNTEVLLAEVTDIDVPNRRVVFSDGELHYDTLIVATGATHQYFGHDEWEQYAPGLKTIEDATEIRRRILLAYETAERVTDVNHQQALLTFVVVGAGPTGVELAGALAELARHTLKHDFRSIDPTTARILLVEAADRVLPPYPPELSAKAAKSLERLGVEVRLSTSVTDVQPQSVTLKCGDTIEEVPACTVLWAAGVAASPLGRLLARATGAEIDRTGRVMVQPDLSLPDHAGIFVIGDLAHLKDHEGKQLPGVAPVAMQEGAYVARLIKRRLKGETTPSFRYKNPGTMATIGPGAAVADLGWLRFSGYFAWLLWLFIHLLKIVQFESRLLVMLQWGWNYFTRNRSARLITGDSPFPLKPQAQCGPTGPAR